MKSLFRGMGACGKKRRIVCFGDRGNECRKQRKTDQTRRSGQPHLPAVFAGLEGHAAVSHAASYLADRDRRLRAGMAVAVAQRLFQAWAQGQCVGRCRTSRRPVAAIRAGTWMI